MDGMFARGLGNGGGRSFAIAETIVAMAQRPQLRDLCAMGCDAVQGYLSDHPFAGEDRRAAGAPAARGRAVHLDHIA